MKELVASERSVVAVDFPQAEEVSRFAQGVAARSQIIWEEHCTECDYPRCYASCAFYEPRSDLHCRRFVAGIETVRPISGPRLAAPLMLIRMKKWGKLEGRGPSPLRDAGSAMRREMVDGAASRVFSAASMPLFLSRGLARRMNALMAAGGDGGATPDAFVIEGWTPDGSTRAFTLTFLQAVHGGAAHQNPFTLGPDYRRIEIPFAQIAAAIDLSQPYLIQIEPVGEADGVKVVFGLIDFVSLAPHARDKGALASSAKASVPNAPPAKVVVWDLDETLWRGTLVEDGVEGVSLRPEAAAAVKELDARGVLQSIASKNDATEALAALRHHGLDDYFLYPQITWEPKSGSIATIARALDLGIDSFVLIDDQAFERAEAQAAHPHLRVLTHQDVPSLLRHPWFAHPATPESASRRSFYQAEARRAEVSRAGGGDYLAFLRASGLTLDLRPLVPDDAERVFELSQRTNQLNFTGAKLTRATVDAMAAKAEPDRLRVTLRCADRFGEYGLIGFGDLDLAAGELAEFFMSCRAQRKHVEHAAFQHMADLLTIAGRDRFTVRFKSTARNAASTVMLSDLGFSQGAADPQGISRWRRGLDQPFERNDIVIVKAAALPKVAA